MVLTAVSQSAGWSALFHAAKDGHVKIVTKLVDAGADVLLKDNVCISVIYHHMYMYNFIVLYVLCIIHVIMYKSSYRGMLSTILYWSVQ